MSYILYRAITIWIIYRYVILMVENITAERIVSVGWWKDIFKFKISIKICL